MRLLQLELHTSDLAPLRAFYAGTLGVPLARADDAAFTLRAGITELTFRRGADCRYHFAFNIPEARMDAARGWLAARGVALLRDGAGSDLFAFASWNAHSIYFRDPAGNVGELIARHSIPSPAGSAPFSARDLLNVSEIGLAADDVPALVGALTALGLGVYDAGDGATFSAVGDEHGLLIVARRGRIWYPETGLPAGIHPLRAAVGGIRAGTHALDGFPYHLTGV
jgi:catechol-2,3-dioxygenase